ncbi:hypothetical protein MSAN_01195100 [Mycena sanguinolenta]|uniref:Uncharacterized protein n=1 Tax=Mycena sanguinolenta TaxID=230812 RepID=A0A8H7D1I0_9AGAR|nr:hypothetical protein MSAN_01195100 [Mycena sanguinolenta]
MFQPFDNVNQFYPGLILWCDPNCYEMDISTLAPGEVYDRKKARELRPCLVVAVNHAQSSFQVARICATKPTDTRRWVRIDSPPPITWRLSDAWIWVGTPPTVTMVLNNAKVMHPHKHTDYTSNPVATSNLQNYLTHRQHYLRMSQIRADNTIPSPDPRLNYMQASPANMIYATPQSPGQSTSTQGGYFNQMHPGNAAFYPAPGYAAMQPPAFTTLSAQPVVVPPGFTETHPSSPGWWRNPETGWFWHASRRLLPPSSSR